ncbi:MAG: iron-containing alcohol dehydrogenase family protein [Ethanoligenens sp.]
MSVHFFLPTRVLLDEDCIRKNASLFKEFGTKALIVTGKHSARANGSLQDVTDALTAQGIGFAIFDKVETNPTIANVREGAAFAKQNNADFVIGIGGGSPMDASKAIALLACQDLPDQMLFTGPYTQQILPLILLPTTAGTGSEVTQYSILTNDLAQSKTSIATPLLFPKLALIDAKYTSGLPLRTTINTAIDALSHAIEGMLSTKANAITNVLAEESIRKIVRNFSNLLNGTTDASCRADLIYASTLAGIVIAHTGTTAVHCMGYSLTYFHHIDHGRANGLLLASFLAFAEKQQPEAIRHLLNIMGLEDTAAFRDVLNRLFGEKEKITNEEFQKFSGLAIHAKNIANCTTVPSQDDLYNMYVQSFS